MKLNKVQKQLVDLLIFYRSATPIQLAKIVYGTEVTTASNQKYIYGQLKELAKKGIIESFKPNSDVCRYLIYQLSRKGLEWYQDEQNIEEGDLGTGWVLGEEENRVGYFEYGTHKPPRTQLDHYLMGIDVFTVLHRHGVKHRNNLYAKRSIQPDLRYKSQTVKPDGEMIFRGQSYMIEIDTGSESHEQLVEKFTRYFHYATTYRNENNGVYDVQNILFIMKGQHNKHTQRRWKNILAAYYKSMRALHAKFNLQLVLLSDFERFINLERKEYTSVKSLVARISEAYNLSPVTSNVKKMYIEHEVMQDGNRKFLRVQTFSTPYGNRNVYLFSTIKKLNNVFLDKEAYEPYLPDDFGNYGVEQEILQMYADAKQCKYTMF